MTRYFFFSTDTGVGRGRNEYSLRATICRPGRRTRRLLLNGDGFDPVNDVLHAQVRAHGLRDIEGRPGIARFRSDIQKQ